MRSLAAAARVCKPCDARPVPLSHPLAVQFTPEQMAWLDRKRIGGLTRSAVIRLVVEEAMRREEKPSK